MYELQTKRLVRLFTVEKATVKVVLAACFEIKDGVEVLVGEPRIVKIIPKKILALAGDVQSPFMLPGILTQVAHTTPAYKSPFVSVLFGNTQFVVNLAPQPPTK